MDRFTYDALPGRIVFGPAAARTELCREIDRLGAARILLISTERGAQLARELAEPFADRVVEVFTAVRPHVPVTVADAARTVAATVAADVVLSVGGGSTTGTAKAVVLTTGLPIVAVPTTYSGSEVTPVWGLTDENRKRTGRDRRVLPTTVIYDPQLTLTLPVDVATASGLNAMAHCVDALWAPGHNPVSALTAEEGLRVLAAGLPAVVADPADLAARSDLHYGAYLAGSAFAVTGSGLHHTICHVLGGAFDLPHARTHAIVLPHVLAFNGPAAPDATRRIGRALDAAEPIAALHELTRRLGIPAGLRELGLRAEQVEEAVGLIEPRVPADNPRPIDTAALRGLIHSAWAGVPLSVAAPTTKDWAHRRGH